MKGLFWILALFAAAVGLPLAARYNTGYVLLVPPPYRIELSLSLFLLLLAAGFALGYGLVRLALLTLRLPVQVREFRLRRAREAARQLMLSGLKAFFEGRYAKAERAAAGALEAGESPAINAAVAARAAHELRAFDKRDGYLSKLEQAAPEEKVIQLMAQAEFLLDQRSFEEALKLLERLRKRTPAHGGPAASSRPATGEELGCGAGPGGAVEAARCLRRYSGGSVEAQRPPGKLEAQGVERRGARTYWQRLPAQYRKEPRIAASGGRRSFPGGLR